MMAVRRRGKFPRPEQIIPLSAGTTSYTCERLRGAEATKRADFFSDSAERMRTNGSMMCGRTIRRRIHGHHSIALDTFRFPGKAIPLPWSAMSCIFLVVGRKKEQIWAIWPRLESRHGAGTHFRTWDRRRRPDPAIA